MIITCNKCSTRFNLDDSLVREKGSKVRCSVCKDIFTVYPLPREPEQTYEALPDFIPESAPALDDISDFKMEDTDFSFEENEFELSDEQEEPENSDFEFESEDISMDADENKDNDFDGIEFESMKDDEPDKTALSLEEGETDLKIEDGTDFLDTDFDDTDSHGEKEETMEAEESEAGEEFELEFDEDTDSTDSLSDNPDDLADDDPDESPLEIMQDPDDTEETITLESVEPEEEIAEIIPEDDFSDYDAVLDQETEPEENAGDEEDVEEDTQKEETMKDRPLIEKSAPLMDLPQRSSRRKKKPLLSLPVLMLLLLFFMVTGAYVASIMTGYKIPHLSDVNIPFLEKYLKKTAPEAVDAKPIPNENSVNGRFVSNTGSGTLFVITGRVDNPSSLSFSHIEVQGTLSTKEIPVAKTKNAFCGNIITEEMLKSGNIAEIMKLLEVKEGAHNSNMNIKPASGVPFMIVFSDLPEKLQNFNVKVVGFDKAAGN